jgi:hypothetical protein
LTGITAGNIYGQIALFWSKIAPLNPTHGSIMGMMVGVALWAVLFFPLATYVIQPRLDSLILSAPNQEIQGISLHFHQLYFVVIGGSYFPFDIWCNGWIYFRKDDRTRNIYKDEDDRQDRCKRSFTIIQAFDGLNTARF